MRIKNLRPDSKGRITLGKLAEGVSGFSVTQDKHHRIILEPYTEVPIKEAWLFKNPVALNKVKQGLQDSKTGKLSSKGSFAKYKDEEAE